jgi:hydrogenase/urease accessory protein HupE
MGGIGESVVLVIGVAMVLFVPVLVWVVVVAGLAQIARGKVQGKRLHQERHPIVYEGGMVEGERMGCG